ncbi:FAD-dependent oxidoreductase [Dethiosulfatarculus sandiegensis]|uniref:FAD-dependent oxidoreductase n=1 Tax=Dethiosulfatarculus sandiegensis TaxID=1429043 RepID=A0A0D2J1I6_9BACT|nr:FAD-dependent oxidoreductase [Dethiosulfatarculus sandiegensis]
MVIIGGGVIGASIAYQLAVRGLKPLLLEAGQLAHGSSGACDGMVLLQSKKPGIHLELAIESMKMYQNLAGELGFDVAYRQTGGMLVMETEAEVHAMEKLVQNLVENGLDAELAGTARALEKEPNLSPAITGASFCSQDGLVNPIRLTHGFMHGAKKNGALFFTGAEVTGFEVASNKIKAVKTSLGRVETGLVINAAGARAAQVALMAGISLPIKPRKGELIVTEPVAPLIHRGFLSAKYVAAKFDPSLAAKGGQGVSMEQTEEGNLLIGSTREFVGFDRRTTLESFRRIAANACRLVPALRQVKAIRTFAGFRPYTPDGLPALGPAPNLSGLIMAAGHEGDGIALAPVTGRLVAEYVYTGQINRIMEQCDPARFSEQD